MADPPHRLTPLFAPRSIAVIGASARPGRPGRMALDALRAIGFAGRVHPVTPTYPSIEGLPCVPDIASLPGPVDLAVLAGSAERLEADAHAAIAAGARALVAFATARADAATGEPLAERVAAMAREAGVPLLGPNSIGFVNYAEACAGSWSIPLGVEAGPIALIIQSGATYATANSVEPRARFGLTAHPGQEADVTVGAIMDYALRLPGVRVVGLMIETFRDPPAFEAALVEAARRDIAVVALKIGRTESGARHVVSHAGKLAGSEAGFAALCRRHAVARAETMDEWWSTLLLLGGIPRLGPGGVAAITDSGGQRALLADHAEAVGVRWARIAGPTRDRIAARLAPDLPATNPLDAWGGEPDWIDRFTASLDDLARDPDTAIAMAVTEYGAAASDPVPRGVAEVCRRVAATAPVPVVAASFTSRQFHADAVRGLAEDGIVVLDGGLNALKAVRHALDLRDARGRPPDPAPAVPVPATIDHWRARLRRGDPLDEAEGLALLAGFGLPTIPCWIAATGVDALAAAHELGFPVAIKTAAGVAHKSDVGGVRLALGTADAVADAYEDLSRRLGPRVLVQAMAPRGVELALGITRDADFGSIVVVGAGGELVEILDDAAFALPPFGPATALRMVEGLRLAPLLDGARGRTPVDRAALAEAIARFSVLAYVLGGAIAEADVNPLIVGPWGATAVDALIRPHAAVGASAMPPPRA